MDLRKSCRATSSRCSSERVLSSYNSSANTRCCGLHVRERILSDHFLLAPDDMAELTKRRQTNSSPTRYPWSYGTSQLYHFKISSSYCGTLLNPAAYIPMHRSQRLYIFNSSGHCFSSIFKASFLISSIIFISITSVFRIPSEIPLEQPKQTARNKFSHLYFSNRFLDNEFCERFCQILTFMH